MSQVDHVELQKQLYRRIMKEEADTSADYPRTGPMAEADGCGIAQSDCSDRIEIHLKMDGVLISNTSYLVRGCVFTLASGRAAASLMRGKTLAQAKRCTTADSIARELGGLPEENFHCAQLASEAAANAIDDSVMYIRDPWRKKYRKKG